MNELEAEHAVTVPVAIDPLLGNAEMPLRARFYPQGIALDVLTNSQEVLAAAEESWGRFRQVLPVAPIELRIGVRNAAAEECPRIPDYRAWRNLLSIVGDADNYIICEMASGYGYGWLTHATVENRAFFRYHFLEGAAWMTLSPRYLTPLHAACVRAHGKTLLLCGDSGAGKSSLSYACAKRGWTFLSDDSTSLVRERQDRMVIGNPYSMRFREVGVDLFPELLQQRVTPRATGEMAIEVDTATMPELATELTGQVDCIVFLNRRKPGPPRLASYPVETARAWFSQEMHYGEEAIRQSGRAALQRLLTAPVYELCYRDLDWAINRLEVLARDGV